MDDKNLSLDDLKNVKVEEADTDDGACSIVKGPEACGDD